MLLEQFYQEINQLSDKVEALIESKNEQECPELLSKRQALLEQLADQVALITDVEQAQVSNHSYQLFLRSIVARDDKYTSFIKQQTEELKVERKKQMKGRKAVKAYHDYRYD